MFVKIKKTSLLFREFGVFFTIRYLFYKITHQYDKYIRLIYEFLCVYLEDEILFYSKDNFKSRYLKTKNENVKVWVCWWQGYDKMPEFCKMCYENLKSVLSEEYELILISEENYNHYTEIPEFLVKRLNDGMIPVTQFCDVLRQSLIYNNGGIWIDASIWCTKDINKQLNFKNDFWSVKLDKIDDPQVYGQLISECKWGSFLLGGQKGSLIYKFVFEAMCKYYENHVYVLDYFLQNLLMRVAYENIPLIKEMVEEVKENNSHIYDLYRYMNRPYDAVVWKSITSDTAFFKLTQKRKYQLEIDGEKTFFAYLQEQVGKEYE